MIKMQLLAYLQILHVEIKQRGKEKQSSNETNMRNESSENRKDNESHTIAYKQMINRKKSGRKEGTKEGSNVEDL